MEDVFNCDKCGLCCQNLNKSELYNDLNDGTGVCVYFDKKSKLCMIYENRPLKCNIDKLYNLYFRKYYSIEEYYKLNKNICDELKEEK